MSAPKKYDAKLNLIPPKEKKKVIRRKVPLKSASKKATADTADITDNIVNKNLLEDMTDNYINDMSVRDFVSWGGNQYLDLYIDWDGKTQKKPFFITNSWIIAKKAFQKMGEPFLDRTKRPPKCELWGNQAVNTSYGVDEFDKAHKFISSLNPQTVAKLNAVCIYLHMKDYGVIDCDSPESVAKCLEKFPNLPRTKSFRGNGFHFFFRKHKKDDGQMTILAKNLWTKKELEEDPSKNIDLLMTTALFERTSGGDTESKVENWDGKFESVPFMSFDDYEDTMGISLSKARKKMENVAIANKTAEDEHIADLEEKGQSTTPFDCSWDYNIVKLLVDTIPVEGWKSLSGENMCLTDHKAWFMLVAILANQEKSGGENMIEILQTKMKAVADFHKIKTWVAWKNENVKTFEKLCESPNMSYTLRSLWDIAYRYNRTAFREASSMDTGQPCPLVLSELKEYSKQKEYWEKFAYYVSGGKEAIVYVKDYKYGEYIGDGLKISELKSKDWNFVGTWIKRKKVDDKGKPIEPAVFELLKLEITFINKWIKDLHKRRYTQIDFLPTGSDVRADKKARLKLKDRNVRNSYEGLKIEGFMENPEMLEAMKNRMAEDEENSGDKYLHIRPFLSLIWFLCGEDKEVYEYVLRFISITVLYPACLAGVFIVFKSIPGCGKNLTWDYIGRDLIGGNQYLCSASESVFFDKHTTELCEKVLVMINEMSYGVMKKHLQTLKESITEPMKAINPKNEKIRWFQNCMNAVGGTNANTPMPIEAEDRRMLLIECSSAHKSIPNFFDEIVELQRNDLTGMIFYTFLKEWCKENEPQVWKYDFQNNRPKTAFQKRIQTSCLPLPFRFWTNALYRYNTYQSCGTDTGDITEFMEEFDSLTGGVIFQQFTKWCEKYKEGGGVEGKITATSWGSQMSQFSKMLPKKSKEEQEKWLANPKQLQVLLVQKEKKVSNGDGGQKAVKVYKVDWEKVLNYLSHYTAKEEKRDLQEVKEEYASKGFVPMAEEMEFLED